MSAASSITPNLTTIGLIAAGAVAFAWNAAPLAKDPELKAPLNPFGINTSPFGEVLAMAMQGPVDTYWNNVTGSKIQHRKSDVKATSFRDGARIFLEDLERAAKDRTNPNPASDAQKRFLRRQIEDKLRFAYELDPGHYANYASYHFFLTEPAVGTRRQLTKDSALLADRTIRYCLSHEEDPRYALTAAAAAQNMLQLMFNDTHNPEPRFTTTQMREYLTLLDHCLSRYDVRSTEWEKNGNWSLLSDQRLQETQDRLSFILKVREASIKTIERLESGKAPSTSRISTSLPFTS